MNQDNCTSQDLSKRLDENGCELESDQYYWREIRDGENWNLTHKEMMPVAFLEKKYVTVDDQCFGAYPAYDILNDICVRYVGDFFKPINEFESMAHPSTQIFHLLQQGKKQEAEQLIIDHCVFFKKDS
jgi:hypothetical protein